MYLFGAFDFVAQQSFLKGKPARPPPQDSNLGFILVFCTENRNFGPQKHFAEYCTNTKLSVASCLLFLLLSPYSFQCASS